MRDHSPKPNLVFRLQAHRRGTDHSQSGQNADTPADGVRRVSTESSRSKAQNPVHASEPQLNERPARGAADTSRSTSDAKRAATRWVPFGVSDHLLLFVVDWRPQRERFVNLPSDRHDVRADVGARESFVSSRVGDVDWFCAIHRAQSDWQVSKVEEKAPSEVSMASSGRRKSDSEGVKVCCSAVIRDYTAPARMAGSAAV